MLEAAWQDMVDEQDDSQIGPVQLRLCVPQTVMHSVSKERTAATRPHVSLVFNDHRGASVALLMLVVLLRIVLLAIMRCYMYEILTLTEAASGGP